METTSWTAKGPLSPDSKSRTSCTRYLANQVRIAMPKGSKTEDKLAEMTAGNASIGSTSKGPSGQLRVVTKAKEIGEP